MFFFSFNFPFFSYIIQEKATWNRAKSNLAKKGPKKNRKNRKLRTKAGNYILFLQSSPASTKLNTETKN